jgi:hypothetical protein
MLIPIRTYIILCCEHLQVCLTIYSTENLSERKFCTKADKSTEKYLFYGSSCCNSIKTDPSSELTSWEIYLQWI